MPWDEPCSVRIHTRPALVRFEIHLLLKFLWLPVTYDFVKVCDRLVHYVVHPVSGVYFVYATFRELTLLPYSCVQVNGCHYNEEYVINFHFNISVDS
jgi:hypothetical protein